MPVQPTVLIFFLFIFTQMCLRADPDIPSSKEKEFQVTRDRSPLGSRAQMAVSYADVVEGVRDSVVTVYVSKAKPARDAAEEEIENPFDLFPQRKSTGEEEEEDDEARGSGSGVIVSVDGLIVTNAHVVREADKVHVRLRGSEEDLEAIVVGTDPATDIALLKVDNAELKPATLGDSDLVRPGDVVLAVGSPFGLEQTITLGIISATGRGTLGLIDGGMEDFLQTDAAINPGNSGGPLVDGVGRVIGINTARYWGDSIGFAVPTNLVLKVSSDLYCHGWVVRGFLGVHTVEITPKLIKELNLPKKSRGVIINHVEAGEAAAEAGFLPGDVVVAVNGRKVENGARFRLSLASQQPGEKALFKVWRSGEEVTLNATLGEPPELRAQAAKEKTAPVIIEWAPGLFIAQANQEWRMQLKLSPQISGLVVTKDLKGADGALQLAAGDEILLVNGRGLRTPEEAGKYLEELKTPVLLLKIRSQGEERFVAVQRDR